MEVLKHVVIVPLPQQKINTEFALFAHLSVLFIYFFYLQNKIITMINVSADRSVHLARIRSYSHTN